MAWIIGAAVIGFMLAPLLWILPSPRQQRQTRLREAARLRGLQVRVTTLPQTRRQRVRREAQERVVSYTRPIHNRKPGLSWKYWLAPVDESEEDTLAEESSIRSVIVSHRSALPEDGVLLEYTGLGLTLYWRERGATRETVEKLADALSAIVGEAGLEGAGHEHVTDAG